MTMSRPAEWCWVLLAFLVLNLASASTQPPNTFHEDNVHEEQGADGQIYHAMARNMPRELPPQGMAPFVYRIGTPLLAAGLAKSLDWPISAGFDRLNVAFNALSVILLLLLLQRHVASVTARLLVIVAFMVEPHSPVRFSYFHPLSVDPAVLAGLLAGLLSIEWFQSRPIPRRAALVALLVAVGVAFHEVMLIVGACALFGPLSGTAAGGGLRPSSWRDRLAALDRTGAWLPLISGAAALLAIHAWVAATPSDYSASAEALRWLREKSLLQYGMAWWLVFGPLLAVPIFFWRRSISVLRERPVWLAYLSVFAVLAWLGGSETERLLVLASPVVYVLIARALSWANVGATSVAMASLLLAQALSSRVFAPIGGPIQPPEIQTEIWERLGWAETAWALSYENMWSQLCSPSMMRFYLLWYGLMGGGVLGFLWHQGGGHAKVDVFRNTVRNRTNDSKTRLFTFLSGNASRFPAVWTILGTTAALAPVVWLAFSRFYWSHYAQPGYGYFLYNLARLWTLIVVLAAFWATGSRLTGYLATRAHPSEHRTNRFIDAVFCGAAAWSVGVVLLAMLHLYYVWVILPLLAVAVALAVYDLAATRGRTETDAASDTAPAVGRWGLVGLLLRVIVVFNAAALLLTIALWGTFGGDNDVPGNYLPYYEAVLRAHSNGPNDQWVHFFVSKGHGLAFLLNILSDAQGAALATWLMVLLGGGLIWRLAARSAATAPAIGLVGVCLYLQFYAEQGAYAKGHIIRNVFILYLILSFTHFICFQHRGAGFDRLGRALVIAAVILLSPLAIVLLLPILLIETVLVALLHGTVAAKHSLFYPGWAIAATALVCLYNFLAVGLPELHAMPAFAGQLVDIERLSRWIDPQLAHIDHRLVFMRPALTGSPATEPDLAFSRSLSLGQVLPALLNPATMAWVGGSAMIGILGMALSRGRARSPGPPGYGAAAAAAYLLAVMAMLAVLRMFGGGQSSMGRFTDFATPLGIALGVVLVTATWTRTMGAISRGILTIAVAGVACAAIYLGSPPVLSQHWRSSAGFLIGQQSYAAMNETFWDTVTAHRMAGLVRGDEKVELLNFLPGFTAVPATPFQRPDGAAYIRDYTTVLYGSVEQAAGIYAGSNINYFLFDVSGESRVVWSGFSALFTPESIRSRMRLVSHDVSERRDLYLLTWNGNNAPAGGKSFETFLQKWGDKLAAEKKTGSYHAQYEQGARRMGLR